MDPQFVAQKRSLEDVLQAKSSERVRVLMSEHTQAQVAALDRTTSDILLQIRAVDTHLANGYPHLPAIVKPVPLSVSDVQKRLSGETQFSWSIGLGEEQSWLFAVTQDHFTVHKLPPRKAIENLARLFYTSLTARTSIEGTLPDFAATVLSQRDSAAESTGRLLGVTLLGNVASLFMGRRIVVVFDGALHYVPFAALALTRMQNTRYRPLIAEHEIVELPSASVLKVLRSRRRSSPMSADIAVFADPVFDRRDERVTDEGLHGLRDSSGADQVTGEWRVDNT